MNFELTITLGEVIVIGLITLEFVIFAVGKGVITRNLGGRGSDEEND